MASAIREGMTGMLWAVLTHLAGGTTAAPVAVGAADHRGLGREAGARGRGLTGPPVPRRAGPAGDGPEMASRAGAPEVDVSSARSRRTTAAGRHGGGAAPAPSRGEPALGLVACDNHIRARLSRITSPGSPIPSGMMAWCERRGRLARGGGHALGDTGASGGVRR